LITFVKKLRKKKGIENYREHLLDSVKQARGLVDKLNEKIKRIKEGEDILKKYLFKLILIVK